MITKQVIVNTIFNMLHHKGNATYVKYRGWEYEHKHVLKIFYKICEAFGLNCYASEELQARVLMKLKKSELQLFIGYVNMIE